MINPLKQKKSETAEFREWQEAVNFGEKFKELRGNATFNELLMILEKYASSFLAVIDNMGSTYEQVEQARMRRFGIVWLIKSLYKTVEAGEKAQELITQTLNLEAEIEKKKKQQGGGRRPGL